MPKVSVIIPIYKVEKYIERCAKSLLEQTLNDIEYIFIDDCTPDSSIEILKNTIKQYSTRLDRIKIERMTTNSRQAAVRDFGLSLATGDYVIHCDSDDWVDTDLYEKLYDEAIRTNADVVFCPIRDEYSISGKTRQFEVLPSDGKDIVANWYKQSVGMFCWNKLVKRSILTDNNLHPFAGVNMWEDNGIMFRVMYYAKTVSQIEGSVYHYNQANTNAITSGYGRDAVNQMMKCASLLDDFFKKQPDSARYKKTVNALKYLAKLNLITYRFDWLKEYYSRFPESNEAKNYITLSSFSTKGKVRFLMVKYHLAWLFVLLFKLTRINKHY